MILGCQKTRTFVFPGRPHNLIYKFSFLIPDERWIKFYKDQLSIWYHDRRVDIPLTTHNTQTANPYLLFNCSTSFSISDSLSDEIAFPLAQSTICAKRLADIQVTRTIWLDRGNHGTISYHRPYEVVWIFGNLLESNILRCRSFYNRANSSGTGILEDGLELVGGGRILSDIQFEVPSGLGLLGVITGLILGSSF